MKDAGRWSMTMRAVQNSAEIVMSESRLFPQGDAKDILEPDDLIGK